MSKDCCGPAVGRRDIGANGSHGDTGDRSDFLTKLLDKCSPHLTRLDGVRLPRLALMQHQTDMHDVMGIVAKRKLREIKKTADGGAGCGHEQQGKRDLSGDERTPAASCGCARRGARAGW